MGVPKAQYDQLKQKNTNLNNEINDNLDMIRERDQRLKVHEAKLDK